MGIDKQEVRWVVHWDAPSSLEGFYQEPGRGGRDGSRCISLLYCSQPHLKLLSRFEGSVGAVAAFAMSTKCRRQALLAHFGEHRVACAAADGEELCDVCSQPQGVRRTLDPVAAQVEGTSTEQDSTAKPHAQQLALPPREATVKRQLARPVLKCMKRRPPDDLTPGPKMLKKTIAPFKIPWRKSLPVEQ